MAQRKEAGTKELIIGLVAIAVIIGLIVWGFSAVFHHPKQTDTTSGTKSSQTASTKAKAPALSPGNTKLNTILTNLKKQYPHVNDSYLYTASKDGGGITGGLNKPGSYTAGAAFCDSYDTLYTTKDTDDTGGSKNSYGFECGGTIQVYRSAADVAKVVANIEKYTTEPNTKKCLLTSQGNSECSYVQVGDVLIHVSDVLTDTQQQDLMNFLSNQVTANSL